MSEVESKKTANLRVGKRRLKRFAFISLLGAVVLLVAGELIARFGLGLGTPPLSIAHPTIEYMFKPNQDVRRFDNRVKINAYGMRSDDFPKEKQDPNELRIMVLGDSVINGGNLTDQSEICTEILKRKLEAEQDRPVVVGNISAGSWGPPNLLAYVEEYGTFDADLAIIVLSSHDWTDVPTFKPLSPETHPERRPVSALAEGFDRYFFPQIKNLFSRKSKMSGSKDGSYFEIDRQPQRATESEAALRLLLNRFKEQQIPVLVVCHRERAELISGANVEGLVQLKEIVADVGVELVDVKTKWGAMLKREPLIYRDEIHLNTKGQILLADIFWDEWKSKV